MSPNDIMLLDNSLKVRVVRELPDGQVIIAIGADTHVVEAGALSTIEG